MSAKVLWFVVLLFAGSPRLGWSQETNAPSSGAMHPRRKSELIAALSTGNPFVRRRAMQELQAEGSTDSKTLAPLLEALRSSKPQEIIEIPCFVELLSSCISQNPLVASNEVSGSDGESAVVWCCAIGKAKDATPSLVGALRGKASIGYPSNEVSIVARAVLANLGIERASNAFSLRQSLDEQVSRRRAPILDAMLLMDLGSWSSEYLKPSIERAISQRGSVAVLASLLAARWGEKGRFALPSIEEIGKDMPAHGDILLAFAKARLMGNQTNWVTPEVVALLGDSRIGFDREVAYSCILLSTTIVDSSSVPQLKSLLASNDSAVVCGAAKICWGLGIPAQSAEERLLILAQKSPNEDVRLATVMALGTLGSSSVIQDLEAAARREPREIVKDSIANAVGLIELRSQ